MNINNLTIEQMREILSGAPDGSERYSVRMGEYFYSPSSFHCFDKNKLVKMDRGVDLDLYESFIWLDDLRTAIAEHDLKQCQHGYDIACLLCGFGNENGVRVWRKKIESDEVTDIRNHVSPSTRVVDL